MPPKNPIRTHKACIKCNILKEVETCFDKGYATCKECVNENRRIAYKKDPSKVSATNKKSYIKHRFKRNAKSYEWVKNNPDKRKTISLNWYYNNKEQAALVGRKSLLKRKYGITQEDYERILKEQNNGCAICKCPQNLKTGKVISFCIDHNHITGEIRGLLCDPCNIALGKLKLDNPNAKEILDNIAKYLGVTNA